MNIKHTRQNKPFQSSLLLRRQGGFTLVELMVGIVVGTIVAVGVFSTYRTTTQTVMTQRQVADMQQQMRGSQFLMERDIRATGYDPTGIGTPSTPLGVQDIRRYDGTIAEPNPVGAAELDPNGSPTLTVNYDLNADGIAEQITYLRYDIDSDGIVFDLVRRTGAANYELLAEGLEAIGFAYAFDADFDDKVDLQPPDPDTGNIIWAVDSDNDNDLDSALDTDLDGDIDGDDVEGGVPLINGPWNLADVPVDRIRMVRVWLLCRSTRPAKKAIIDTDRYLVGDRFVGPFNDTIRRRILEMNIRIRNL